MLLFFEKQKIQNQQQQRGTAVQEAAMVSAQRGQDPAVLLEHCGDTTQCHLGT